MVTLNRHNSFENVRWYDGGLSGYGVMGSIFFNWKVWYGMFASLWKWSREEWSDEIEESGAIFKKEFSDR